MTPDPRTTTRRALLGAATGLVALAGCLTVDVPGGDGGGTADGTTPTGTETAGASPTGTATPTPTSGSGSTGAGSLELVAFDATGVYESSTLLVTGTIQNPTSASATALFVGEIHVQDGDTYTGRRFVTVPAGNALETRVKVRHGASGYFYYDHDAELVADPDVGREELRLPDAAHDLVVVEADANAVDDRIEVTAEVENMAPEPRSATLGAEVRITGGSSYTESREIRLLGGRTETFELVVRPGEGGYTYRYRVQVG